MKPTLTDHCIRRMDKRGLRLFDAPIIIKYGVCKNGVFLLTRSQVEKNIRRLRHWLSKHQLRHFQKRANRVRYIIHRLDKLANWITFVSSVGKIITTYRTNKRGRRKFAQGKYRVHDKGQG